MALAPPTCPVTGKHIRWLLLAAVLSYFIYFLVHGLSEPPSSRAVHICDTGNELELIQCNSTEDVTTCANLLDINGNVATCVESSCGYQLFPHIDVSIAGSSDPYDEDAATSTTSFLSVVSVFYSLVPYLLGFVYLVEFLAFGNLVPLSRLVILGVIAITNEVIFKNLVKQNRPEGSCLYFLSFGMPSGHAASSIGLLTYLLLELFVYHPNLLCGLTCQKEGDQNAYYFQLGYGWKKVLPATNGNDDHPYVAADATSATNGDSIAIDINDGENANEGNPESSRYVEDTNNNASAESLLDKQQESNNLLSSASGSPSPLSPAGKWTHHLYGLGYILLLLPVPFSRVYLHDHLRSQVGYGALIGIVAAMIWYLGIIRNCGKGIISWRLSEWGKWWGLKCGWKEGFF